MFEYHKPRIYVGPLINEVILNLGRVNELGMTKDQPDVKMILSKRSSPSAKKIEWISYLVSEKNNAHFEIPECFITSDDFTKGLYDADVYICDCLISQIEIVKAPSRYVRSARVVADKCSGGTKWIEPSCQPSTTCNCQCHGNENVDCECGYDYRDNCPNCLKHVKTLELNIIPGYLDR